MGAGGMGKGECAGEGWAGESERPEGIGLGDGLIGAGGGDGDGAAVLKDRAFVGEVFFTVVEDTGAGDRRSRPFIRRKGNLPGGQMASFFEHEIPVGAVGVVVLLDDECFHD